MSLERLKEARQAIENAEKVLYSEAKATLTKELQTLFSDPEVQNVAWAQRGSEYSDEGMNPGVHGPILNAFDAAEDEYKDWIYEGAGSDLIYGYDNDSDPRLARLSEVLDTIGDEILSDLYGDQNIVVVLRSGKGARIITEYAGC